MLTRLLSSHGCRDWCDVQQERFKEAARQLETDDDPRRFDERMKKLVKQKPADKAD